MGNSAEYRERNKDKIREYMRAYYKAHSTHTPMIPGAERQSKKCRYCGVEKLRDEYSIRKSGPHKGHLAAYCKPCMVIRHGKAVASDPSYYRRIEWPSKLKRLYGMTVGEYYRMLDEQGGGCAMCGTTDPNVGNRKYKKRVREAFDVDHCHETGVVRGLLCTRCNRMVGLAGNDAATAQRLVMYLLKTSGGEHDNSF